MYGNVEVRKEVTSRVMMLTMKYLHSLAAYFSNLRYTGQENFFD